MDKGKNDNLNLKKDVYFGGDPFAKKEKIKKPHKVKYFWTKKIIILSFMFFMGFISYIIGRVAGLESAIPYEIMIFAVLLFDIIGDKRTIGGHTGRYNPNRIFPSENHNPPMFNPSTGLPMIGSITDIEGNPYVCG